ncbi:hypothetical protein [Psychrobacter sp. FME5]|uniref:hypothetical protein n=2 Tax=unclassified Psychrobacter TaxID=196806 RepID=UPI0017881B62|nr:hypothetical protein [Psychrobacter sp. FME5]MBE0446439.1 hypothetical protein [Psychrobacter sp. FME5]
MTISKEQFFNFGLKETIYSSYDKAEIEWNLLKNRIYSNEKVFIRGFGRDASGTHLFQAFYERLINNYHVEKDPTNNSEPAKLIRALTGYSKTKSSKLELIRNYQISHVFGRTKNVFAFTAPWNIVYMPKILDPFTGHEAKGDMIDEYTFLFQKQCYDNFEKFIEEFNEIMISSIFKERMGESLDTLSLDTSYNT